METQVARIFGERFQEAPLIVRSPGRVNLIGEHTDYNEGFVLPAAIDMAVWAAVSHRLDDEVHLYSADFDEGWNGALSSVVRMQQGWANYPLGIVDQLLRRGYPLRGFNMVLGGDVPIGAGLSSSAAVECAVIFALNELFRLGIPRLDMAKMAQRAEHRFAGVQCGIMDQFASLFGKAGCAIKLDCRTLEHEYIPLNLDGVKIVLLDTNVKHSLASTAYNERRAQCHQGVEWIRAFHPEVQSLRDTSLEMLDRYVAPKDPQVYRRCRYVLRENQRLLEGCESLKRGDLTDLGQKMFASHEGLRKEYEVSCAELDFLVAFAKSHPEVLGARMMGGGFGGCTINLVRETELDHFIEAAGEAYRTQMNRNLTVYVVQTGDGTEEASITGA